MELDTQPLFDWANETYDVLNRTNDLNASSLDKWSSFDAAFANPPALLTHASIERYGQITPPEELSPVSCQNTGPREGSVPVNQMHDEVSWQPPQEQMQALADYDPATTQSHSQDVPARASKRRRTAQSQAPTNQTQTAPHTSQQQTVQPSDGPTLPKRKRGRPKSVPQPTGEAFTKDGIPLQVTSARQSHLEKNRVAAHKCRQRKKEYINGLEGRAREFSSKNKQLRENVAMLRDEILTLKNEVLRHAGCGFWAVDEYLARCAGDLLGMDVPSSMAPSRKPGTEQSPTMSPFNESQLHGLRESSADSYRSLEKADMDMDMDMDDYSGLDLLEDIDEEN
ncbi:hypothetical protein P154DRAFT_393869, partial [Amniculicola lignicola CBS 123094]